MLIAGLARAYVNHGRWVADCPGLDCASALVLQPRQGVYQCPDCWTVAPVDWPADADDIWSALSPRPPARRNWYPASHDLAVRFNLPHGQTPAELRTETAENMGER